MTAETLSLRLHRPPVIRRPMLHRIFRADPMTVRHALSFLRERFDGSAGEEVIFRVELALAEILNNICQHGGEGAAERPDGRSHAPLIHLCVIRHVGGIACAVTDDGIPLPDHCLGAHILPRAPPADERSALPEGGFGWFLIQDLTASLSYFREGRRNFLAFIVPLGEATSGDQFSPNCSG